MHSSSFVAVLPADAGPSASITSRPGSGYVAPDFGTASTLYSSFIDTSLNLS